MVKLYPSRNCNKLQLSVARQVSNSRGVCINEKDHLYNVIS